MAKWQNDAMLDAALDYVKNNATLMILCSAQPATYAEATTTYDLADIIIDSSDFTHSDGTTGRKTTVAQQLNVTVDHSGTGNHVAITSGSVLLYVTTCASLVVTATETINFPAWTITLGDAT